jgi:hypothetical protein
MTMREFLSDIKARGERGLILTGSHGRSRRCSVTLVIRSPQRPAWRAYPARQRGGAPLEGAGLPSSSALPDTGDKRPLIGMCGKPASRPAEAGSAHRARGGRRRRGRRTW